MTVELVADAVYRTARKLWPCECDSSGDRARRAHRRQGEVCIHPECRPIQPGECYVEYLAGAEPFQMGPRYCMPCGVATWANP